MGLINIGFGNVIVASRVVAILTPASAPMKRVKKGAKEDRKLVDATHGRKTRAIIITDSDHVILSAVQPETIAQRFSHEGIVAEEGIDKTCSVSQQTD